MNRVPPLGFGVPKVINRLADHVEHTTKRLRTDRNGNGRAGVPHLAAALESVGGRHSDRAHELVADVLSDFKNQVGIIIFYDKSRADKRQVPFFEPDVNNRPDDLCDGSIVHSDGVMESWSNAILHDFMTVKTSPMPLFRSKSLRSLG